MLRTVMGRDENLEFPMYSEEYLQGALTLSKDLVLPNGIDRSINEINVIFTAPSGSVDHDAHQQSLRVLLYQIRDLR